jgi:hypothetical protein
MAINLANSVRVVDPARPICLVYNEKSQLTPAARSAFDHVARLEDDARYVGVMNKLRLYELAPYRQTMFIDADCFLVKTSIDAYWAALAGQDFNVAGAKASAGRWKNFEIADLVGALGLTHLVQMNNGVFYFEKTRRAEALFARMRELLLTRPDLFNAVHQDRPGQLSSEPFFAVAMAEFGIDPIAQPVGAGSWMVTTWRARRCRFDPDKGVSYIEKPSRFGFGLPFLPAGWVGHSPVVAHFIGLRPRGPYQALARYFADHPARRRDPVVRGFTPAAAAASRARPW